MHKITGGPRAPRFTLKQLLNMAKGNLFNGLAHGSDCDVIPANLVDAWSRVSDKVE